MDFREVETELELAKKLVEVYKRALERKKEEVEFLYRKLDAMEVKCLAATGKNNVTCNECNELRFGFCKGR